MTHLINISGGKDSQAVAIWFSKNKLHEVAGTDTIQLIFCDTGNEAGITYEFIQKVLVPALPAQMRDLRILKNKRGETLLEQAARKGRFPSKTRRFCTTELKVEPMIDHIISINDDVIIWDGRRRQESPARSTLTAKDDYFDYEEAKGKYKVRAVRKWLQSYSAVAIRPIIDLSAKEVFDYIAFHGHKRNPLYDEGFNRVGCFPCIMCSLGEIIRVAETEPERITAIRQVEHSAGTTFFGPNKIPVRFCRNQITNDKGKLVGAPTISEVIKYAYDRRHDSGLFQGTCQNRYVACE